VSEVRVWGRGIRLLHWMLATGIAAAWCFSSDSGNAHLIAGCITAATSALRTGWGMLCGPRSARLMRSLRGMSLVPAYLAAMARHKERRYLGHNPLGSLMVLTLLTVAAAVCLTGWIYTTDMFWGYGWLARLHHVLAWLLVGLVALHLAGVVFTSLRGRGNLVAAMLTGRKQRRVD
jgi:cytochrome b